MTPKNVCIPRELQLQAAMFRLGKVDDEIMPAMKFSKNIIKP